MVSVLIQFLLSAFKNRAIQGLSFFGSDLVIEFDFLLGEDYPGRAWSFTLVRGDEFNAIHLRRLGEKGPQVRFKCFAEPRAL